MEKRLSFLFFRRLIRRRRVLLRRRRCRVRCPRHAFLETADAFAQASRQLRNLPPSEQEQDNRQDYQPMDRTKLAHESPPRAICGALLTTLTQDALRGKCACDGSLCLYRITRSSPARRVARSRSRYSRSGIAYLRVMPVNSLKASTEMRSPLVFLKTERRSRSCASASQWKINSGVTRTKILSRKRICRIFSARLASTGILLKTSLTDGTAKPAVANAFSICSLARASSGSRLMVAPARLTISPCVSSFFCARSSSRAARNVSGRTRLPRLDRKSSRDIPGRSGFSLWNFSILAAIF